MTEACSICGEFSRDSCSHYYEGRALLREVRKCPMLSEYQRGAVVESLEIQLDRTGKIHSY